LYEPKNFANWCWGGGDLSDSMTLALVTRRGLGLRTRKYSIWVLPGDEVCWALLEGHVDQGLDRLGTFDIRPNCNPYDRSGIIRRMKMY